MRSPDGTRDGRRGSRYAARPAGAASATPARSRFRQSDGPHRRSALSTGQRPAPGRAGRRAGAPATERHDPSRRSPCLGSPARPATAARGRAATASGRASLGTGATHSPSDARSRPRARSGRAAGVRAAVPTRLQQNFRRRAARWPRSSAIYGKLRSALDAATSGFPLCREDSDVDDPGTRSRGRRDIPPDAGSAGRSRLVRIPLAIARQTCSCRRGAPCWYGLRRSLAGIPP